MTKHIVTLFLLLFTLFASFTIAHGNAHPYWIETKREFRAVLFVKRDASSGNAAGSLFTLYDKNGDIIGGAGFLNGYNSFKRNNIAAVSFYLKPGRFLSPQQLPSMETENLGLPFKNARSIYLLSYHNKLIAVDRRSYFSKNSPKYYSKRLKAWRPVAEIGLPWDHNFRYFTPIKEGRIDFYTDRILFNGKLIYKSDGARMDYFYANSTLYIYNRRDKKLYLYDWKDKKILTGGKSTTPNKPSATYSLSKKDDLFYMIGDTNNGVVFWSNFGNVYLHTKKQGLLLLVNRRSLGMGYSNQAYACLRWFNKLLIGHYPTGNLLLLGEDNRSLLPFFPRIPHQKQCSKYQREAQSLAIYAGDIYAGVWPWGEIWTFDQNAGWSLAFRPFTSPLSHKSAPYLSPANQDNFGQRISSFVTLGEDLFLSTSNKTGEIKKEIENNFPPNIINQYGCAWRLRKPFNLVAETKMSDFTRLDFVIRNKTVQIWQDNKLLISADVPYLKINTFINSFARIKIGKGVYGTGKNTFIFSTRNLDYRN